MVNLIELNVGWFDFWVIIHFAAGFLLALIGLRPNQRRLNLWLAVVLGILVAWELFEIMQGPGGFGGMETWPNAFWDVVVGMAGAVLAVELMRPKKRMKVR